MIWLIGNKGMLGSEVERLLHENGIEFISSDREVDITDYSRLQNFVGERSITWIINCSAYTAVDKAEDEPEAAFKVNADGAGNIARIAASSGARLIHISTDYVFDGEKNGAYTEEDRTNPIGIYGGSKLKGEEEIVRNISRYFIIRTAWLYGKNGNNFVHTMLRLFRERDEVRVVADQWGTPTYAPDLASAIVSIISSNSDKYGIYHFTNEGKTNWYEFACEICRLALKNGIIDRPVKIVPISTDEYPTKAKRPRNSLLSKAKIKAELGIECRDWDLALEEYIKDFSRR